MAKLYYNLIKARLWTIEKVPEAWKAATQTLLDADAQAQGTKEKFCGIVQVIK